MLAEQGLHAALRPEVHGAGQHLHGYVVDAEEVADEDDAIQALVGGAQPRQRADVVSDCHQSGAGQVLRSGSLIKVLRFNNN